MLFLYNIFLFCFSFRFTQQTQNQIPSLATTLLSPFLPRPSSTSKSCCFKVTSQPSTDRSPPASAATALSRLSSSRKSRNLSTPASRRAFLNANNLRKGKSFCGFISVCSPSATKLYGKSKTVPSLAMNVIYKI